jgi:hypothetical protein
MQADSAARRGARPPENRRAFSCEEAARFRTTQTGKTAATTEGENVHLTAVLVTNESCGRREGTSVRRSLPGLKIRTWGVQLWVSGLHGTGTTRQLPEWMRYRQFDSSSPVPKSEGPGHPQLGLKRSPGPGPPASPTLRKVREGWGTRHPPCPKTRSSR